MSASIDSFSPATPGLSCLPFISITISPSSVLKGGAFEIHASLLVLLRRDRVIAPRDFLGIYLAFRTLLRAQERTSRLASW